MLRGNAVFIREEAKLARNIRQYTFLMRPSLLSTLLTSLNINQTTRLKEIICSREYDVTLRGVTKKAGTNVELKASHFLNN